MRAARVEADASARSWLLGEGQVEQSSLSIKEDGLAQTGILNKSAAAFASPSGPILSPEPRVKELFDGLSSFRTTYIFVVPLYIAAMR